MAKNKEFTSNGVREFSTVKGCHSCCDCKYLTVRESNVDRRFVSKCQIKMGKSSIHDSRFPYDNTTCKSFEEREDE